MNAVTCITLPAQCANLRCPNLTGEGKFVLVETEPSSNGTVEVALHMCAPCADTLGIVIDDPRIGTR